MFHRFTQHPATVGESYLQHFLKAAVFGGQMILAGLACVIHAALPFLFQQTASDAIGKLNRAMEQRRMRCAAEEKAALDEPLSTGKSATSSIG